MPKRRQLTLVEVCAKIGSGATPRGGKGAYRGGAISLIRSQNVYNDRFVHDGLALIDDTQADELRNVIVNVGDVLLNITGDSVARCCQVDPTVLPARVNQHVAIIRPKPDQLDSRFLRFLLVSPAMQAQLHALSSAGATRNALTKAMLEGLVIDVPELPHQRAIAHILGTLDDKIELNRQMNETLEAMARAFFKSWFVDFDPVRAKAAGRQPAGMDAAMAKLFPDAFEMSELGEIPRGWRVTCLRELTCKIGSGSTPRGGDQVYLETGVSFIRSQNVYDSTFVWEGLAHISDDEAKRLSGVAVQSDDVLLNITGASILRTCVVESSVLPARVNQHVAIVRARDGIPARYLHNHLLAASTKAYLLGMDAGASRQAVTKSHIESVPIIKPNGQALQAWHGVTQHLYSLAEKRRSESRLLSALRDTLLPPLLSGDLSIPDAERFLGRAV